MGLKQRDFGSSDVHLGLLHIDRIPRSHFLAPLRQPRIEPRSFKFLFREAQPFSLAHRLEVGLGDVQPHYRLLGAHLRHRGVSASPGLAGGHQRTSADGVVDPGVVRAEENELVLKPVDRVMLESLFSSPARRRWS